ncbi:MAG: hypothetical protein A2806_04615 [Candidatus Terrybacteria bacterium RIFCSPHIGHO2_01_FULL_48_17]|uniref:Uncharacterized protein n=1 Tax=Candidatus Terrybacteria bacterium RIFCSPHIGHO2_01_FULL_48_17 TaxID=1802362 RepID=A0A1G2PKV7_9BACT|nr:MAG: hypothetical protein A2806_04615 [Candidatus Terrybacteria bacterium RIFCSPHIGHO2_01_FULL_48_17]OHA52107.1 MAG: hypothetical protein A3A30_04370 [Candidatus Terrybacteria bacterium RIFCSPLOWO2_01_FULL_48_14]
MDFPHNFSYDLLKCLGVLRINDDGTATLQFFQGASSVNAPLGFVAVDHMGIAIAHIVDKDVAGEFIKMIPGAVFRVFKIVRLPNSIFLFGEPS